MFLRWRHHFRISEACVRLLLYRQLLSFQGVDVLDLLRRWHRHQVSLLRGRGGALLAAAAAHGHLPTEHSVWRGGKSYKYQHTTRRTLFVPKIHA